MFHVIGGSVGYMRRCPRTENPRKVENPHESPKKRRWRFGLRWLFVATLVAAAICWACIHPLIVASVAGFSLSAFLILGLFYHLIFAGWNMDDSEADVAGMDMRHIWALVAGSIALGVVATAISSTF